MSLASDLKKSKSTLEEFYVLSRRVLIYLPEVIANEELVRGYKISTNVTAGTKKYIRPINISLFINSVEELDSQYDEFLKILDRSKSGTHEFSEEEHKTVNKVLYTLQQSIGAGFDLLVNPNSARKHVGNRFEELLKALINHIGIANNDLVFQIPYETENGQSMYRCQTDLIISPFEEVKSDQNNLHEKEVILSFKTSSKDRMGKIFLDKLLMENFSGHEVKVVGVFLNDVQRKGADNISYTFVSGLFMVYTKFLTTLEGVYFIDPPPRTEDYPFNEHVFLFSKFILNDIWKLIE